MSDTSDSTHALRCLSLTAGQMKPHTIGYLTGFEPNRDDIRDFQYDFDILAGAVDRVIEARGKELEALGIVSAADVRLHFTNVLRNALDGNALYAIENGIEQRISEREFA